MAAFLRLFILILSGAIIQECSSLPIDAAILQAARESGMNMNEDQGNGTILVELDILYDNEEWQRMRQSNSAPGRQKRKAVSPRSRRWTDKVIPYKLSNVFSSDDLAQIQAAISEWETYSCLDFRPATSTDRNYIFLQNGGGCASLLGMDGGRQPVLLAPGCRTKEIIIHELGHAVGFLHEQNRPDRDDFITILHDNIAPGKGRQFEKYPPILVNDHAVSYDYRSIMHYGETAFGVNERRTIVTKDPAFQNVIGNSKGLSFKDVKLANLMYGCNAHCSNRPCPGEGFLGKDCECWCPGSPTKRCNRGGGGRGGGGSGGRGGGGRGGGRGGGGGVIVGIGGCEDRDWNCAYLASIGECSNNPGYMLQNCKKSCQVCYDGRGGSIVGGCQDSYDLCPYWASVGQCYGNPTWMLENCKLSCQACSGGVRGGGRGGGNGCRDYDYYCSYWASAGYCTWPSYQSYMTQYCPLSCNRCGQFRNFGGY